MRTKVNHVTDIFADLKKAPAASSGDKDERAALFAEINQGTDVTSKLKKVTADMQTHKNPNLRAAVSLCVLPWFIIICF